MATVRLATFNAQNLFARWKFAEGIDPEKAMRRGWIVDETFFTELGEYDKELTAQAIKKVEADVICLQEVENVETLKRFRSELLGGLETFEYVAGIDGNDPRLIDVAVLSRRPIVHVRSHQHLRDLEQGGALFSRDCLEVGINVDGVILTLFVNHLKSMLGGREGTRPKRERQAAKVREIVEARFGPEAGAEKFVVLGDLNDYLLDDEQGKAGIRELAEWDQVENVVNRIADPEDRWTHYWEEEDDYKHLDYMLVSKSLAAAHGDPPEIMRRGLPKHATRYTGPRFDGIGDKWPKASDHCPVVFSLRID